MRFFNTTGPVRPDQHYFIPHRLDMSEVFDLIERQQYFVLHAPRQTGKTTAIKEITCTINEMGKYNALYINIENAQAARNNTEKALLAMIDGLGLAIRNNFEDEEKTLAFIDDIVRHPELLTLNALQSTLTFWAKHSSKPIILFIDEIDSLMGDSLLSVLRQIRSGFTERPTSFPQSICLIGLRDVRDYKVWSKESGDYVSTSSPFNIKAKSLLLQNFSKDEVVKLYAQHTEQIGQPFNDDAVEDAFYLTQGQPWLVNALAYQACFVDVTDRTQRITREVISRAKETLIKRRDTHLDSLLDKLREERVRPIIEAIITGETDPGKIKQDDLQYVRDLGLIRHDKLEIANPIYREIIPRELTSVTTELITETSAPFKRADGSLNATALLEAFVTFYRENSAIWLEKFDYKEAGPHLLMMAFLQRVINGGGSIQREYALGTRRVDILLKWQKQTIVIELKIRYDARSLQDGLKQAASYMDSSGAEEGHLVLFDRDPKKSWEEKIYHLREIVNDKTINVWGL